MYFMTGYRYRARNSTFATGTIFNIWTPPPLLSYDPEWLAITRAFHLYLSLTRQQSRFPEESEARALIAGAAKWVEKHVKTDEQGAIPVAHPQTFVMTAPGPGSEGPAKSRQRERWLYAVLN